jgi:hypothetical protein
MRMRAPFYPVFLAVIALATGSAVSGASMGSTRNNTQGSVASCAGVLANNPTGQLAKGTMTALIDGTPWTAVCFAVNVGAPGIIGLGGSDNLSTPTTFGFGFAGSNRVGTYPVDRALGINALLTVGPAAWQAAAVTNGSGTLTFTTSTRSHVAGTFSFTLLPGTLAAMKGNTAKGTRVATNGAFDITF